MAAFIIVDSDIHDVEGYSKYRTLVTPLLEKHGGTVIHRIVDLEALEGDWQPKRLVIIEFPDKTAAKAFINDPDYAPAKEIRFKTADSRIIVGSPEA